MNHDQAHAQADQQIEVGGQVGQRFAGEQAVGYADNQCFTAQVMDIGRGFAEAADEAGRVVHSNKTR